MASTTDVEWKDLHACVVLPASLGTATRNRHGHWLCGLVDVSRTNSPAFTCHSYMSNGEFCGWLMCILLSTANATTAMFETMKEFVPSRSKTLQYSGFVVKQFVSSVCQGCGWVRCWGIMWLCSAAAISWIYSEVEVSCNPHPQFLKVPEMYDCTICLHTYYNKICAISMDIDSLNVFPSILQTAGVGFCQLSWQGRKRQ